MPIDIPIIHSQSAPNVDQRISRMRRLRRVVGPWGHTRQRTGATKRGAVAPSPTATFH